MGTIMTQRYAIKDALTGELLSEPGRPGKPWKTTNYGLIYQVLLNRRSSGLPGSGDLYITVTD